MDTITERRSKMLRSYIDQHGYTHADLARKLGVTRAYISMLCMGTRPFGEKAARTIEAGLGLPSGFFDGGSDKMISVETWNDPSELSPDVYALVPRLSVGLSAGSGLVIIDETELPPLAFRRDWLLKKNVTSKLNLRIVTVKGDSMAPYLSEGDIVMLDLGQTEIVDGQVYAIRYGDELRIKRLFRTFDGGMKITSDNPNHPDERINHDDMQHVAVIGRLIWRAG